MPIRDPEERRAYNREWMRKRRADWFAGKVCAECGGTDRLELDHADPAIKVTHAVWSWSAERRETELVKCRPMCHECHLRKSATERPKGERHWAAKLTADQVAEIRRSTLSRRSLAEQYNVSPETIKSIRGGLRSGRLHKWKENPGD